tara:strand:- start:1615 stop:1875 length:261 start_codon:yes stop_codon:yes gene_type:complete
MDLQKTITGGTAAIAVGTASMVGGGAVVDKVNDGPAKRQTAVVQETKAELKDYIDSRIKELLPATTGKVVPAEKTPQADYREQIPK